MKDPDSTTPETDELDLFELLEDLWNQKLLIAFCSAVFVAIGGIYLIVAPERWTAEARITLPTPIAIAALNPPKLLLFEQQDKSEASKGTPSVTRSTKMPPELTAKEVIAVFFQQLLSVQTLLAFDAAVEEPLFQFEGTPTVVDKIRAANSFLDSRLVVTAPSEKALYYKVQLSLDNPVRAAQVLNDYLMFVNTKVIRDRERYLELIIRRMIEANEFEIQWIRRSSLQRVEEELLLLEEALRIARATGVLDNQSDFSTRLNSNRQMERGYLYLRGEKVLIAEIQALQKKAEATNLIPRVRDIELENALLSEIQVDTENAIAYELEMAAIPPVSRDEPKARLLLALALVLGGMVGVLTALIRSAVRRRRVIKAS